MSTITDFVAELVRAANEIDKLGDFEKRRLLERSVTTIRDMRDEVGIRQSRTTADAVIDLQTTAAALYQGKRSSEEVKAALLHAAEMIRALKIILDAKDEVTGGGTTH
ncbi:hypothetical protein ACFFP0_24765 [Rhizobium puerariae]|uniref:Uncharacterized protein n=1 Tax=Rhizobium puerariae TaxID=1585791 RepID=A0ABV6APP6_9HYPH